MKNLWSVTRFLISGTSLVVIKEVLGRHSDIADLVQMNRKSISEAD